MFRALIILLGLFAAEAVSAQTITISGLTVNNTLLPMPGAASYYVLTQAGDIITASPNSTNGQDVGDWLTPKINMSNFQVKVGTHSCTGGPSNVTIPLSSWAAWHLTPTGGSPQSRTCTFVLEISAIANPTVVLDSATITLNAWY